VGGSLRASDWAGMGVKMGAKYAQFSFTSAEKIAMKHDIWLKIEFLIFNL